VALQLIAVEKRAGLMGQMRLVGLHESAYWLSWLALVAATALVAAVVAAAAMALITEFRPFSEVSFGVHAIALWCYSLASSALAMVMASVVRRPRWVNMASFTLFAGAAMSSLVFSAEAGDGAADGAANWYDILSQSSWGKRIVLSLLPPFHYGKILSEISQITGITSSAAAGPAQYTMSDFFQEAGAAGNPAPSAFFSCLVLLALCVGYIGLAWYLGQVFTADLGAARPFYFPGLPSYWAPPPPGLQEALEGDTLMEVRSPHCTVAHC